MAGEDRFVYGRNDKRRGGGDIVLEGRPLPATAPAVFDRFCWGFLDDSGHHFCGSSSPFRRQRGERNV